MFKRLIIGLLIGLVMGGVVSVAAVEMGFGVVTHTSEIVVVYVMAALTGIFTGLVAGKPIWSKGGQIEAGLKAFFGALLGVGAMFAIRTWLHPMLNLGFIQHGMQGELGQLPVASLPLIAAVLGGFYELDNTPEGDSKTDSAGKGGGSSKSSKKNVRVASADTDEEDEAEEVVSKKTKR